MVLGHSFVDLKVLRAVYELQGEGLDGEIRYFRKPWFMTTLMFMGMSLCLPLAYLEQRSEASAPNADPAAGASEPLLEEQGAQGEQVGSCDCPAYACFLLLPFTLRLQ